MIPIGYMLKTIVPRPDWIAAQTVERVCFVSGCVSEDFMEFIPLWRHNGWWMFDSPEILRDLAEANQIDIASMTLLFL